MSSSACVYLVGTGPGDPDLLTVKALRLLQNADVVVYDRLVSEEIIQQIPTGVSRIYVGKSTGNHTLDQEDINKLLVKLAETERNIVRLKGGDPYIFGRGGEEALYLTRHGISFEIVPGITSASACGAYAGIPLTHRGYANTVQFVTGHAKNNQDLDLNWPTLVDANKTLVIYMGLSNIGYISSKLVEAGMPASTPAAAIENGSTNRQHQHITELGKLADLVKREGLSAPVLFIIGQVVTLANELDWYVTHAEAEIDATFEDHEQDMQA
ncbi:MAG: uroporphyrinogen-III C-methyltransferase [Gammaproteobacteria bacterium]|nr:uroporphyrinogen-III C-methyltransferase [Gammaproteobacteria bacterium]